MNGKGDQPVGIHGASDAETMGGGPRCNWHVSWEKQWRGGVQAEFWVSSNKKEEVSETGVGGRKNRPTIDLASPRAGAL